MNKKVYTMQMDTMGISLRNCLSGVLEPITYPTGQLLGFLFYYGHCNESWDFQHPGLPESFLTEFEQQLSDRQDIKQCINWPIDNGYVSYDRLCAYQNWLLNKFKLRL